MRWSVLATTALFSLAICSCGDEPDDDLRTDGKRTDRVTEDACAAAGWIVVHTETGVECEPPEVESARECEALGGHYFHFDVDPGVCSLPTPDAGMPCVDGSECVAHCAAPPDAEAGTLATGSCAPFTIWDCWTSVQQHVVQPTICY